MKLAAQVTIDRYRLDRLNDDETEKYVTALLSDIITKEVLKNMAIASHTHAYGDSTTYTGTITATNPNTYSTIAPSSYNSTPSYSQIAMRVVEYTKNGKVTRVELQRYDDHDNQWCKIPRIQIEE